MLLPLVLGRFPDFLFLFFFRFLISYQIFFPIRTLSVLVYFTMLSIRPGSVLRFLNLNKLFAAKGDTVVYCCKMDTVLY